MNTDNEKKLGGVFPFLAINRKHKPPEWALTAELHFLCMDYSNLIKIISALPAEHKHRFAGVIKSMTDRLTTIHDLVEAKNGNTID